MGRAMIVIILMLSPIAEATEQSNVSKISFMTVGDTYARVQLQSMKAVEGCPDQSYYVLDFSNGQNKEMYSALLTAKASQQEIYLLLSGCHMNRPKITHVYLQ